MINKSDISIEKLEDHEERIYNKTAQFRNDVLELLKTLEEDKILIIQNVDKKYYNNVRIHIGSKTTFAKNLGKIFTVRYYKDKTMCIYIKEIYNK